MDRSRRQFVLLGIGVALLVGGWGLMQYANAQQNATGNRLEIETWTGKDYSRNMPTGSRIFFGSGVVLITVGAGLVAPVILRRWISK